MRKGKKRTGKGYRYELAVQRYQEIRRNQWYQLLKQFLWQIENPRS